MNRVTAHEHPAILRHPTSHGQFRALMPHSFGPARFRDERFSATMTGLSGGSRG